MKAVVYNVFSGKFAAGNPCGVVQLDDWLSDLELLKISQQVAQPVTSFIIKKDNEFHIRWFSLSGEINLCGHGSLGAGAFILNHYQLSEVNLKSQHGEVVISKQGNSFGITLPAWTAKECTIPTAISGMFEKVKECFSTRDLIVVLPSEAMVAEFIPEYTQITQIDSYHALIVTAQSGENEYVLRYFAPKIGINEDFATGSAQCSLAPYWFSKLNTEALIAKQLSDSGGYFEVEQESESLIKILAQVTLRDHS